MPSDELAMISKEAIREQADWLTTKADWRKCERERWRGEVRTDREHMGEENREEMERQEQREHETGRVHTPTTTRP